MARIDPAADVAHAKLVVPGRHSQRPQGRQGRVIRKVHPPGLQAIKGPDCLNCHAFGSRVADRMVLLTSLAKR